MPRSFALWAPVVLSFLVQVPAAGLIARLNGLGPRDTALALLIAIAGPATLIAARRLPGPVVAVVSVLAALDLFVSDLRGPPYIALAFAIGGAIVRGARVWAWVSVGVCWSASIGVGIALGASAWTPGRIALTTLGILIVFGIGENMRTRRDRVAEFRRLAGERRQSAEQAERVRIARELHDVLAHSLSQINVQAGVGLHLMESQPDKAADALASIKETSKSALDEVRSVLGMLRSDPADASAPLVPEPDLSRVPALIDTARASGWDVRLVESLGAGSGDPPVAAPVQAATYRIVQESLTNVARHATGVTGVDVRIERVGADLVVEVRDDGQSGGGAHGSGGTPHVAGEAGGRGLLGMRERADLLGGHLSAGPADDGGFRVLATLPIEGRP